MTYRIEKNYDVDYPEFSIFERCEIDGDYPDAVVAEDGEQFFDTLEDAQIALKELEKVANKEQTQMPTDSALKSLIILTTAIYFIVAAMVFIETRCFVLSTSVTTANRFTKQMKFNLVVFCSNEVVNLLLSTVYVGNAGYLDVLIVVIVIDFLWSAFTVLFISFTFISAK